MVNSFGIAQKAGGTEFRVRGRKIEVQITELNVYIHDGRPGFQLKIDVYQLNIDMLPSFNMYTASTIKVKLQTL